MPCVCINVFMYVYLLEEIYASCVYMYVCAHACVCMYVCVHAHMYVCMCRFVYLLESSTEGTNIFYPHEGHY